MAESVTAKLDRIMERHQTLSLIENRLDSMASTMANIESTLSRLDADVTMLKEGAGKIEKRITDHRAQLDKCKKDLLYLEAYGRRENVKIFGLPKATGNENASEPEDNKEIVHNLFEQELKIENSRAKYEFQRVHRSGKPNSTSSRPIIVRFLRFTDKEEVMSVTRKELKDKVFAMYDDIPKDLYDLRKQLNSRKSSSKREIKATGYTSARPTQINCF